MELLDATFKLITPLAMGGADPRPAIAPQGPSHLHAIAELRPPSVKGMLRYWYRALDPAYGSHEAQFFGGTGTDEGQSSFLLRVQHPGQPRSIPWDDRGYGDDGRNGIRYLSYTLRQTNRQVARAVIAPGAAITLRLIFRRPTDSEQRRAVLGALWLLGHMGGLGSRSRRGFGTVALQGWRVVQGAVWQELAQLPIAHGAPTPDEWLHRFEDGLKGLRAWYPGAATADHTVLAGARFRLLSPGHASGRFQAWEYALDSAGAAMQRFRLRWNVRDQQSDYHRVKAHIVASITPNHGARLTAAPARAAFGLPLTFRYRSLGDAAPPVSFRGKPSERSASPIWIRVVAIGDRCYPLYAWFRSPLLPGGEAVIVAVSRQDQTELPAPDGSLLRQFWEDLGGREVTCP